MSFSEGLQYYAHCLNGQLDILDTKIITRLVAAKRGRKQSSLRPERTKDASEDLFQIGRPVFAKGLSFLTVIYFVRIMDLSHF